jgi:hypothetical protein
VNWGPEAKFLNSNKAQKCIGQRAVEKWRPNKTIKLQHEDPLLGMWTNPGLNNNFINIFATGYTKNFRKTHSEPNNPNQKKKRHIFTMPHEIAI